MHCSKIYIQLFISIAFLSLFFNAHSGNFREWMGKVSMYGINYIVVRKQEIRFMLKDSVRAINACHFFKLKLCPVFICMHCAITLRKAFISQQSLLVIKNNNIFIRCWTKIYMYNTHFNSKASTIRLCLSMQLLWIAFIYAH